MRRVAALLAVLLGLTLLGFTVAEHLFSRSGDAQTISDRYASLMSASGLHGLRTGFDAVQAAGAELGAKAEPRLQAALGMNDEEFAAYVAREMPGIKTFDEQAPGIVKLVGPVIATMEAERGDYATAAQIPTGFLGLDSAPWLFVGIGVLLIAAGALAWFRPGPLATNDLATLLLCVVGLGVFLAPLVIGIPGKVDAAVRVTAIGRVGLAPATAHKAVAATEIFDGMVSDVQTKLEPALSARLGQSDAVGRQEFARSFPTLAGFAESWQRSISAQSHDLSDSQVAMAPKFANADKIPLEPIPWLFIIPGFLIAALAGATLVPAWWAGARERRARGLGAPLVGGRSGVKPAGSGG